MGRTILVTGATGKLGGAVAETLASRGSSVKAAVRDLSGKRFPAGVETVRFDYDDPGTYAKALEDADGVFLVAPPLDPEAHRRIAPFLAEARRTGRPHVVMISYLGADRDEGSPLRILEGTLKDSGLPWTILRPTFFMENFSEGWLAPRIRENRVIPLPAGEGRTPFVSVADIAAVAAAAFEGKRYGEEYAVTGPEGLDHFDVASVLSRELGEEVRYVPLDEESFLDGVRRAGLPEGSARMLASLYRMVREGRAGEPTGEVERISGRRPVTFRDFARRHAGVWRMTRSA